MRIVPVDLQRRPGAPFTPEERAIFRYGGGLDLRADPLAVEARHDEALARHNPTAMGRGLRAKDPNLNLLGFRHLVPVAHAALGTTPLDEATGVGFTSAEVLAALGRFFAFRHRLTREFRGVAEMQATYPGFAAPLAGYRAYCGLWWNRRRVQAIGGVAHFRAATAAAGGPLHLALADAMAASLEEAYRIEEQYENDRAEAEARAQHQALSGKR